MFSFYFEYIQSSAILIGTPVSHAIIRSASHVAVHKINADTGPELQLIFTLKWAIGENVTLEVVLVSTGECIY